MFQGTIGADETYVGARKKRGTKRAMVMERVTTENLRAALKDNVSASAVIMTDEFEPYRPAAANFKITRR